MQLYGIATMNKLKLNVCWITVLTWFLLGLKLLLPLGYLYAVSPNLSASPLLFLHLSRPSLIFRIMFTSPPHPLIMPGPLVPFVHLWHRDFAQKFFSVSPFWYTTRSSLITMHGQPGKTGGKDPLGKTPRVSTYEVRYSSSSS